jgi:electron transfer flavoprotein beta subunit
VKKVEDLNLSGDDLSPRSIMEELFSPPETEGAEMIEGDPITAAEEIIRIINEKGVNI